MLDSGAPGDDASRPEDDEHGQRLDFDWRPEPLTVADPDRMFRWPIVIAALFIGVSVALVIRLFIASPDDGTEARLAEYRAVASDLEVALVAMLEAPTGDQAAVTGLEAAVEATRLAVDAPLPGTGPIGGRAAEFTAAHERLEGIVDAASTLVERLTVSSSYRGAAAFILTVPLLPSEAPADLVDAAARSLAEYQTEASAAAAGLGSESVMADFRGYVRDHLDALPTWSELYLLALRRGETDTAQSLLAELRARVDLARSELDARLTEIEQGTTAEALGLIAALRDAGLTQ